MEDLDVVLDLRSLNTGHKSQYDVFWDECKKFLEEKVGTPVDDRRHDQVVHLAWAISAKDLLEQVKTRCPEGTKISSEPQNIGICCQRPACTKHKHDDSVQRMWDVAISQFKVQVNSCWTFTAGQCPFWVYLHVWCELVRLWPQRLFGWCMHQRFAMLSSFREAFYSMNKDPICIHCCSSVNLTTKEGCYSQCNDCDFKPPVKKRM